VELEIKLRSRTIKQIAIVALLIGLAKFLAFGRDVMLSSIFGAGPETDALFIAITIPGFVFSGVFATIGMVFLPIYIREQMHNREGLLDVSKAIYIFYLATTLLITFLTVTFADEMVSTIAPGAPETVKATSASLVRIFSLGFIFSCWVGLQNTVFQANKLFIYPMFTPVVVHAVAIVGLFVAYIAGRDIRIVAYGSILGWIVVATLYLRNSQINITELIGANAASGKTKHLFLMSIPVFLSVSLDQFNILIDMYIGSSFSEGSLSHLSYASRLALLLGSFFSLAVSHILFPYISRNYAENDNIKGAIILGKSVSSVVVFTAPITIICLVKSDFVVGSVFQRGEFLADDVISTANVLRMYCIGMILLAIREILNRAFLADQKTGKILVCGLTSAVANVSTSIYFAKQMGLPGIALGTSFGLLCYVAMQLILMWRSGRSLDFKNQTPILISTIFGAAAMTYVLQYRIYESCIEHCFTLEIVHILLSLASYCLAVFSASLILRTFLRGRAV